MAQKSKVPCAALHRVPRQVGAYELFKRLAMVLDLLNAGIHPGLPDASHVLRDLVQPALDRRFGDFVDQATAEIEDRTAIRTRSLNRHFERKLAMLREQRESLDAQAGIAEAFDNTRRPRNLRNLAKAQAAKIDKLRRAWQLRENEFAEQSATTPEGSEVGSLLLQVDG